MYGIDQESGRNFIYVAVHRDGKKGFFFSAPKKYEETKDGMRYIYIYELIFGYLIN